MSDFKRKNDDQGILCYGFPDIGKTTLRLQMEETMSAATIFDTDDIVVPEGNYIDFKFHKLACEYVDMISKYQKFDLIMTNIYELTNREYFQAKVAFIPHYNDLVNNRHVEKLGLRKILIWYDELLLKLIDRGNFDTVYHIFLEEGMKLSNILKFSKGLDALYYSADAEDVNREQFVSIHKAFRRKYATHFVEIVDLNLRKNNKRAFFGGQNA